MTQKSRKPAEEVQFPVEYFRYYFDDEFLAAIVEQTNLRSVQHDGVSMQLNIQELKTFLGILIYMGIVKLPSYVDYWASASRVPQVADLMGVKRFGKIRVMLHFADNTQPSETDRMWKVRPVLDHIRKKCRDLEQEESEVSIDEAMILYKGKKAGNLRQYIKNKPHKWGFKFFMLASINGLIYDFFPYTGANTFQDLGLTIEEEMFGVGAKVVIALCKSIKNPEHTKVCFDNYFTGVPLLAYLKREMQLSAIGTVRKNRLQDPPLQSDKDLTKSGRGSYDVCVCEENNVAIVRWVDNKVVNIASTYVGAEPLDAVQRWSKTDRHQIEVPCPRAITEYNKCMGGVDKFDHLCELYRMSSQAKRWYLPIFIFMLNLSLVNSWLLYRRDANDVRNLLDEEEQKKFKILASKNFRLQVYSSITYSFIQKAWSSFRRVASSQEADPKPGCSKAF